MFTTSLPRRAAAEAIGTFVLVFGGCGAIVVNDQTAALGHLGICSVFGLVVGVMIFATGHICGAHFNPAVTLAFATTGDFEWREVPAYLAAQFAAAFAASGAIAWLLGTNAALGSTIPSVGVPRAFGIELLLTFFLMFVIKAVATDSRAAGQLAAVAIGGTVMMDALVGGPLTGASMNPARSLGPAVTQLLVADPAPITSQWLYLVSPTLGAILGAVAYDAVSGQQELS